MNEMELKDINYTHDDPRSRNKSLDVAVSWALQLKPYRLLDGIECIVFLSGIISYLYRDSIFGLL